MAADTTKEEKAPTVAPPVGAPTTSPAEPAPTATEATGPKVLIIEDDPLIHKMYETKFRHDGFSVDVAEDGVSGLDKALKTSPDFIVLDVMMPQMSGIDLLEKLRADAKGKNVPVIVLTNLSEKAEEERALALGVKEYLLKANLTPGDVVAKVKKYLGK